MSRRFNFFMMLIAFDLVQCLVANNNFVNSSTEGSIIRKPKFYENILENIFSKFVEVANDACLTNDGNVATCLRRDQCRDAMGAAKGPCARGFVVCCELNVTCQGHVSHNFTWFRNPMYPRKIITSHEYTCPIVIKRPENIGQLVLNIKSFDLAQPYAEKKDPEHVVGSCQNDTLIITGSDADIPKLCGNLSNQHIYLNFVEDHISLTFILGKNTKVERSWNIQLVLIPFDSPWKAPSGCLQYFKGLTGTVTSFNFPSQHLASLSYSVCVRNEAGMKSIKWSGCAEYANPIDFSTKDVDCDPSKIESATDYITIIDGSYGRTKTTSKSRYCNFMDDKTQTYITSKTRPFLLRFNTGENESEDKDNGVGFRGFCIRFEQSSK